MNKTSLLCWLYIAALLICIVFRIESWPFSDFRVFVRHQVSTEVIVYRLGFFNQQGKREWLYTGSKSRKNKHFSSVLKHRLPHEKREVTDYLKKYVPGLKKKYGNKYEELILFEQVAEISHDGELKLNIKPYIRIKI